MQAAIRIRTNWVGLFAGLAIAAALVATWRVDGGGAAPPARVEIVTSPSAEIAITPEGVTTEAGKLVASEREDGLRRTLEVRNATGEQLEVRLKAVSDQPDLREIVRFDVRAGEERIHGGTLARLESGSQTFSLEPGQALPLTVTAWIPEGSPQADWAARSVSVSLELDTSKGAKS